MVTSIVDERARFHYSKIMRKAFDSYNCFFIHWSFDRNESGSSMSGPVPYIVSYYTEMGRDFLDIQYTDPRLLMI